MIAKKFIEYIENNKLQDYELCFMTNYIEQIGFISYDELDVADIGYSAKMIILSGKAENE